MHEDGTIKAIGPLPPHRGYPLLPQAYRGPENPGMIRNFIGLIDIYSRNVEYTIVRANSYILYYIYIHFFFFSQMGNDLCDIRSSRKHVLK